MKTDKYNYELGITNYELGITNWELRITNWELGINEVVWNAERFSSGIYYYKLNSPDSTVKKMLLLK